MWYDVLNLDNQGKQTRRFLCYVESKDGVHWDKPELGLITFNGFMSSNIVAPPPPGASQHGATVFRDDRALPAERYKLWTKYEASAEDIYYTGMGHDHRGGGSSNSGVFRARLRRDGFVSVNAGYRGDEFTTPVITFDGGRLDSA